MTPAELRHARAALGSQWNLGRPLRMSELGRALRLQGRDPGASVRDWERGHTPISGPVSVAVEAMLAGFDPRTSWFDLTQDEINEIAAALKGKEI